MDVEINNSKAHVIVKKIAQQISLPSSLDCMEQKLQLSANVGTGLISGFDFGEGVHFVLFDTELNEDWTLHFVELSNAPLQFNFLVDGTIWHQLQKGELRYQLEPMYSSITSCSKTSTQSIVIEGGKNILFGILFIHRKKYLPIVKYHFDEMNHKMADAFNDVEGERFFFYQGLFSIAMARCIKKISSDKNIGLVRSIFMESRVLELMGRQVRRVQQDFSLKGRRLKLSKYDLDRIKEARVLLVEDIKNPPTIVELAKQTGVNQQKLKKGFKLVYESTILEYLTNERLEKAALFLLKGYSVKQAANEVGYTSRSYFAKRFNEKYGVLPNAYLKSTKSRIQV